MEIDPYEPAAVQYNDWKGTVAGDEADMSSWEEYLGIDREIWRLLYLTIHIYGGHQSITPYVVSAETSYNDLENMVNSDQPIVLARLAGIDYDYPNHSDFNPPRPASFPITTATDFLIHAFKRLEIKFVYRHIPVGAIFDLVEISDIDDYE